MNDKAEKVYADAFFTLCLEETPDTLKNTLGEESPARWTGYSGNSRICVELLGTPTVAHGTVKLGMIKDIIADGVSEYTGNLLCVLTERGR